MSTAIFFLWRPSSVDTIHSLRWRRSAKATGRTASLIEHLARDLVVVHQAHLLLRELQMAEHARREHRVLSLERVHVLEEHLAPAAQEELVAQTLAGVPWMVVVKVLDDLGVVHVDRAEEDLDVPVVAEQKHRVRIELHDVEGPVLVA